MLYIDYYNNLAKKMKFWEQKSLTQMSEEEFEALCDNCARCCLIKLEDEETGKIYPSNVHCKLLNIDNCQCIDYENRHKIVADCIKLNVDNILSLSWIPKSCAYRLIAENKPLKWWHPLVSGSKDTVIKAGISIKGKTICESKIKPDEWENHIYEWNDW